MCNYLTQSFYTHKLYLNNGKAYKNSKKFKHKTDIAFFRTKILKYRIEML